VLWDETVEATGTVTGDVLRYAVPRAAGADLFRVDDAAIPVYLSFGSLLRTSMVAGVSGHRPVVGLRRQYIGGHVRHTRLERGPWTNAWSTPNAIELAVVRTAPGERPDQLARYVEALRTLFVHVSDWTTKPAPLFFENTLREYLADYELDEEVEDAAGASDDEADDTEEAT
jgi:hypothetical protein